MSWISRIRSKAIGFAKGRDGNVAIETAITLPFVLLALFGSVDIIRYLQVRDSVIRAVSTTADAIGRQNGVTGTQVSAFLNHAADTIDPTATGGTATISVASVHKPGEDPAEVYWRRGQDAGAEVYQGGCQTVGAEGEAAVLPSGFTVDDDDTVIFAEACYTFIPAYLISRAIFNADFVPLDIYGRAVVAARFGSLTVLDP